MSVYTWQLPQPSPVSAGSGARSRPTSLLGMGLKFPLRMDKATGDFQRSADEANISECLHQLVLTMVGERMDPNIGTVVPELPFEQADILPDLAEPSIVHAIQNSEPRVKLLGLRIDPHEFEGGASGFLIRMRYQVRATNSPNNLVVPYFVPGAL